MGKQFTKPQWELKIIEMLQEEPDVTAEERATILEYLSAHFKPGGKIYINKAGAKDLQAALEVSASDAEAIVRYRDDKGAFKTFDDIKNVPGFDPSKIQAKKDHLEF
jgi:competence ComEA-like helix-hairpin-helix protein